MKITFAEKDESKDEVYVGQVRKGEFGVIAIITHGRAGDKDKPLNAILFTEDEDDLLYGVINWKDGTDANRIRAVFPTIVDAELILKGARQYGKSVS